MTEEYFNADEDEEEVEELQPLDIEDMEDLMEEMDIEVSDVPSNLMLRNSWKILKIFLKTSHSLRN